MASVGKILQLCESYGAVFKPRVFVVKSFKLAALLARSRLVEPRGQDDAIR